MKTIFAYLFVISCFFVGTNLLHAQWVQTDGPYGGIVNALVVSGSDIFAGTYGGGVYQSTNYGRNWVALNFGLTNMLINSLAANGNDLFAGTDVGLFRSADNGASWNTTNLWSVTIISLAAKGANLFAGLEYGGLTLSTDNGTSWTRVSAGLPLPNMFGYDNSCDVICIAISDEYIFAVTKGKGLYRSTNNGTSWSSVDSSLFSRIGVTSIAANRGNVFVIAGENIFVSTDNGTNWTYAHGAPPHFSLTSFAVGDSDIFAVGSYDVLVSTDNGITWGVTNGSPIQDTGPSVKNAAFINGNLIAGISGSGVFLSSDNGTSWVFSSSGMIAETIYSLAVTPALGETVGTNLFAGTDYGGGVYLSTDNGNSWSKRKSVQNWNLGNRSLYFNDGKLFSAEGGVSFSTDNGANWIGIQPDSGSLVSTAECLTTIGQYLFTGTTYSGENALNGYFFRSSFNGTGWTEWEKASFGLPDAPVWSLIVHGTNLFAGVLSNGNSLFRSTDYGTTWTSSGSGLGLTFVNSLAVNGANIFAGTNNGVFLSVNNGANWTAVNSGIENTNVWCLSVSNANLFAGTDSGIFLSTNSGANWVAVDSGLPRTAVYALAINESNLFAGTNSMGVWRRPLSEITSVGKASMALPNHFDLAQNYPNPFNPTTTIVYQVPHIGVQNFVSLRVYDVLGRKVATLVNDQKPAGTYTQKWNAENFPSGVYFYRLQAGSFTQTKKLMLLK
jgi:Secretion system C-terminal sorting domain